LGEAPRGLREDIDEELEAVKRTGCFELLIIRPEHLTEES
jgi:hypothetical protein